MRKTRVLLLVLVALFVGFLTACTSTEDLLNAAKDELVANYDATIASETYQVTGNLTLVTEIADATVSWTSSNTAIISNAGVVTRPATDTQVTLTATLTIDGETITHQFRVTVKAVEVTVAQKLEAAKALLVTNYANTIGDDEYVVTADLTLVTTIGEATVSWASSDTTIITDAGVVSAPAFSVGDQTVTLTATLTIGTESTTQLFYAFVEAADETVAERLDRALAFVTTFPAVEGITGVEDWIEFPTSVTFENTTYTVSWVSNKPNFLAVDGTVTRPEVNTPNQKVIMTATITEGTVTRSMEVEFIVFAIESSTLLDSIGEVYSFESGDYVKFEGVTVIGKMLYGFFISDGTTVLYIYDSSTLYDYVVVGQTYDIEGVYDLYYGLPQLANNAARPLTATPSDAAPVSMTGTPATVDSAITDKPTPSNNAPMVYNYLSITAKVLVDGQETTDIGRYNTFLVDPTYTGTTIITEMNTDGKAISYATDGIIIYYQSLNKAAVEALDGKLVTMNILLYGYRSDRMIWYAIYLGDGTDIQATFDTDAEAVAAVKNSLTVPTNIKTATTLNLIDAQHGTTITWASNNEQVIDPATGVVTPVDGQQTTVVLTATIEKGTVVETKTFTIKVGIPALSTIAAAIALPDASIIKIRGILTGVTKTGSSGNTYWMQDATAGINIYADATISALLDELDFGVEIEMIGELDIFNGLFEITRIQTLEVINETPALPSPESLNDVDFTNAALLPYQGQLVSFEGFLLESDVNVTSGSFSVYLYNPTNGKKISARVESSVPGYADIIAFLNPLAVDSPVNVVGAIVGWFNNYQLAITGVSNFAVGTLTDDLKVHVDANVLTVPEFVTEAGTLTLPTSGTNGTTITWTSDNVLIDATTGAVTMPASGQVTVTLTATVTLNSVVPAVATFEVLVGEITSFTATIDSAGSYSSGISDGNIPVERLSFVNNGAAVITVAFNKNDSTTTSIFNNSAGEIRLYGKDGNGG
ncbi:MAG: hypothetical protein RBT65_16520, partial [Methanolobus sp.]|nr:hypothetical protein [Methanolobus sp.]